MDKLAEDSLKKITKGTFIVLIGTFVGMILNFFIRIIIVRNLSQEDYGIFSLITVIITVAFSLASFGLHAGITRYVAYYRARKDTKRVLSTVTSAIEIAVVGGILFFCLVFFGADLLSRIFDNPGLLLPLRVYSIAIPFFLLSAIFVSVYRGFERADIKIIFQEIIKRGMLLTGLGILVIAGFSLLNVVYVYIAAAILTCGLLALYSLKGFRRYIKKHKPFSMKKTLLLFSLPLLARTFLDQIVTWTDVIMIGYFKEEAMVGIYNAALPLAKYIPLFLTSAVFLYIPFATQLYSKKQYAAFKRNYIILTKWVFAMTLPIFLILFLFPSTVLNFLYGSNYTAASSILSVLALGFLIHSFLGPNGATLLVLGKTRFLMWAALLPAILNIILNLILIPNYGILGAAIASAIALACINIINSLKLYALTKIHPFTKNYLKPLLMSLISILIIYFIANKFLAIKLWMLPFIFLFYLLLYGMFLLITKSFDKEDSMLLLTFERKLGLNLSFIKSILKKFM